MEQPILSPRYEADVFTDTLIEIIDKYLQDMISREGIPVTEAFIEKLDNIKRNFSPVTSFNNISLPEYVRPFREETALRELLFYVWGSLNALLGDGPIHDISRRVLKAASFLANETGNKPTVSPFFVKEFIDDLPKEADLAAVYAHHRWLFIPALIAMQYDLNEAEQRLAKWYRTRTEQGTSVGKKISGKTAASA